MADTQTTVESEQQQKTGVAPHESVEVFDTNGRAASRQVDATAGRAALEDAGFGHADLHNAEVIRGDANATDFRSTDLRNSELNTADFTNTPHADLGAEPQGANWGTILMAIALILVIILVGSWLF